MTHALSERKIGSKYNITVLLGRLSPAVNTSVLAPHGFSIEMIRSGVFARGL